MTVPVCGEFYKGHHRVLSNVCGLNFDDLPLRIPSGVVGKTENTVGKYRPRDSAETEKKH